MIKNNLAVLLAERGLKIGDAHAATGISRNTLSSFVNSKANGIQYDTLNKLCEYLDVSPGEILTYIRLEIIVLDERKSKDENSRIYDIRIKLQDEILDTYATVVANQSEEELRLDVQFPREIFNKLSVIPKDYIINELGEVFMNSVEEYLFNSKMTLSVSKEDSNS